MVPARLLGVAGVLLALTGCALVLPAPGPDHLTEELGSLQLPAGPSAAEAGVAPDPARARNGLDATTPGPGPVSTVADPERPPRYVALAECIALALENGRTGAFFDRLGSERRSSVSGLNRQSAPSAATDNVRVFAYDPALAGADVAQAASRFDVLWNSSLLFSRIDQPTRILDPSPVQILINRNRLDYAEFQSGFLKPLPTGGLAGVQYRETYEYQPFGGPTILNPGYRSFANLTFEQPLLRGFGTLVNQVRDAHPGGVRSQVPIPGRGPGLLLARVGAEQARLEFERRVHEVVFAVEEAYWGLYAAYWELHSRDNALRQAHAAWKVAKSRYDAGGLGIEDLAMVEEQYHFFRTQRLEALGRGVAGRPGVLEAERRLRYVVGLPAEDGHRLIPCDAPRLIPGAEVWAGALAEAAQRRPELRQVREEIRAVELNLVRARDLMRPDLRFFSRYGMNGLGTNLGGGLANFGHQEFDVGLQMLVPLGAREGAAEMARARHQLEQRHAFLRDQEAKLLFSLQRSYRDLVQLREEIRTRRSQRQAAETQLRARFEKFRAGGDPKRPEASVDLLLRAQRNWADSVRDEYVAVCNYNVALADYELQKGTILAYHHVGFAEGPLPPGAAPQASRRLRDWRSSRGADRFPGADETDPLLAMTPPAAVVLPEAAPAAAPPAQAHFGNPASTRATRPRFLPPR